MIKQINKQWHINLINNSGIAIINNFNKHITIHIQNFGWTYLYNSYVYFIRIYNNYSPILTELTYLSNKNWIQRGKHEHINTTNKDMLKLSLKIIHQFFNNREHVKSMSKNAGLFNPMPFEIMNNTLF